MLLLKAKFLILSWRRTIGRKVAKNNLQCQYVHLGQAEDREQQAEAHNLGHADVTVAMRGRVLVPVDFAREDGTAYQQADLDAYDREDDDAERQVEVGHFFALMVGVEQVNVRGHVQVVEEQSEDTLEDETGERKTFATLARVGLVSGHWHVIVQILRQILDVVIEHFELWFLGEKNGTNSSQFSAISRNNIINHSPLSPGSLSHQSETVFEQRS